MSNPTSSPRRIGTPCYLHFLEDTEPNTLRIGERCLVYFLGATGPVSRRFVDIPPSNWQQHFRDLLLSELGADERFRVGGKTFPAHRCVLATRSPVFEMELFGDINKSSCVQIVGIEADVFYHLLHFIYTDSLPQTGWQEDVTMARHLLEAANRYDIERLKLICEETLCHHIDVSTVVTTLTWADQNRCYGLKEACFDFIKCQRIIGAVDAIEGLEHFAQSCPSLMGELLSKVLRR